MKNKVNAICLKCGKVQVRTDLDVVIQRNYIKLDKKIVCPQCQTLTEHFATKNVSNLRKQLETSNNNPFVLKLISR